MERQQSVSRIWGTEPHERLLEFPCDRSAGGLDEPMYRGVTINTTPEVVFRWLCQMRVAPYSYNWLDNLGRRTPRRLIPGLERLSIGQRMMFIFEVIGFEPARHITIRNKTRLGCLVFGDIVASYLIVPQGSGSCRLLVKLLSPRPNGPLGRLLDTVMAWLDVFMMRRQLLNFKRLAEATPAEALRSS